MLVHDLDKAFKARHPLLKLFGEVDQAVDRGKDDAHIENEGDQIVVLDRASHDENRPADYGKEVIKVAEKPHQGVVGAHHLVLLHL
ncbi:MAG: hypothetical protein BWY50_00917 [Spirochaetes bacterium ADurb.Bin315]|nr:MAG: hypothetical protein BWY50_00917 [Spirochaetes bacterium ADurb.Bin315]